MPKFRRLPFWKPENENVAKGQSGKFELTDFSDRALSIFDHAQIATLQSSRTLISQEMLLL